MKNGRRPFDVPEPDALSLAELLRETADFLTDYIVFPMPAHAPIVALWIGHTWAFEAFDFTPYLNINSPLKRCGKSTLLDAIKLTCRNPWGPVVSPSPAVLFRKIQADCPTLLLDEVDTIFSTARGEDGKEDVRAVLNGGFQRGATIPRCVGPLHTLAEFAVFCPKALAGIGTLPDTVADRSLVITLARRATGTNPKRFRYRDVADRADALRARWEAWAAAPDTLPTLRDARPDIPPALGDRQADICEPLLAVADLAAERWPALARKSLRELFAATGAADDNISAKLLADIRDVFAETDEQEITTAELLRGLVDRDDSPWAQWWERDVDEGRTMGPASRLSRLLKPFGVASRSLRLTDKATAKGYRRADFEASFKSYLPAETTDQAGTPAH